MTSLTKTLLTVSLLALASGATADDTLSGAASKEARKASAHGAASAAHGVAASGRATSAAAAVPLSVGGAALGSTGAASAAAARESRKAANAPIGTPLEVTNEAITVVPPNEALKPKDEPKKF